MLLLTVLRLTLARRQSDAGAAGGDAALAPDAGACQPWPALSRDRSGGDARLGAFRRAHAGLFDFFGLFHVPQITSPDKVAAAAYEDRHILFAYVLLALVVLMS